ncbi:nuclear poly(A) polymerase 3 isoform X1 [Typha angustifolia]|uniref:nuclear poly(A) polymerase 3 isoform X1 n=1 Tax=Typha angustifolia TaxID=59011 RepID=UPI003C30816E
MAYAYANQSSIVVPAAHLIEPGNLILTPPPPLPPPLFGYFPVTLTAIPNHCYRSPLLVPANPPVIVHRPVVLGRPSLEFLIQMDERRTQSLLQFIASEGLEPSQEEVVKRKEVINQLKQIVLQWIRKVAWQRRLPKEIIAGTSATILTYGSYGLGVHGPESDIDALCVGPYFASLEEDFFVVLRNMLHSRPEVSEIHCVKSAKVPLMRFKFNGISVDFPYVQVQVISVSDNINIFDPFLPGKVEESGWRSLSGVRANQQILRLVPNVKNFQSMLRCMKLWAKRRGIYSHLLGFFGGIHLAIIAAYVCQRHPNASCNSLLTLFFENFSHWPWPRPVILQDQSINFRRPDDRALMPIMMPCSPFEYCNSNITRSTFRKIKAEFQRGYALTRDIGRLDFEWSCLFEAFPYGTKYAHFVQIVLAAPNVDELRDWVGWVKSRFRSLLLKLEIVEGYCDPNPTEYVDHNITEPNVVFYWGLLTEGSTFLDINSVKEDFMRSVINDVYGEDRSARCKLELSVIESSQLPKSMLVESGVKGCKACWRILDNNQLGTPVYSQYVPHYFVGYAAS